MGLKDSLCVMIVDDMSTSRGLITQALDEIGIINNVSETNGADALKKLAANPVHLVISDYNMPGMNGLQLLKGIRDNKLTRGVGFILVTGSPTPEIIDMGRKLGMNNLIKKPFSVVQMKSCIEQVVGRLG